MIRPSAPPSCGSESSRPDSEITARPGWVPASLPDKAVSLSITTRVLTRSPPKRTFRAGPGVGVWALRADAHSSVTARPIKVRAIQPAPEFSRRLHMPASNPSPSPAGAPYGGAGVDKALREMKFANRDRLTSPTFRPTLVKLRTTRDPGLVRMMHVVAEG